MRRASGSAIAFRQRPIRRLPYFRSWLASIGFAVQRIAPNRYDSCQIMPPGPQCGPCPPDVAATDLALEVSASSGPVVTWTLPADPPRYWYVTFHVSPPVGWLHKGVPVAGHKTRAGAGWFNGVRPPSGSVVTATVAPAVQYDHYKYRRGASVLVQAEVPDTPPAAIPRTPGIDPTPDVAGNDVTVWWHARGGALDYTLQRATTIGPDSDWREIVTQAATTYTDWNLPPGRYYYRVRANNSEGSSGWTAATDPVTVGDP